MDVIDLERIAEGSAVVIDSAPLIYFLDGGSPYAAHFEPLFVAVQEGRYRAVVSTITVAEVVAGPLRHGNEILAEQYFRVLTAGSRWQVQALSADLAFDAARIRSRYRLKLPDAVQIATAVHVGAAALITHDRDFRNVKDILVLS